MTWLTVSPVPSVMARANWATGAVVAAMPPSSTGEIAQAASSKITKNIGSNFSKRNKINPWAIVLQNNYTSRIFQLQVHFTTKMQNPAHHSAFSILHFAFIRWYRRPEPDRRRRTQQPGPVSPPAGAGRIPEPRRSPPDGWCRRPHWGCSAA